MGGRQTNQRVSIVDDVSIFRRESTTQFQQSKIAQKNPQLVLNADLPLSNRRDVQTTQNNATITKQQGEYRLRATADTNSFAELRTRQRGNYLSGSVLEAGMGIRIPEQPTGDAVIQWGYYDGNDGIFFRYNSDGLCLVVKKSGSETVVRQKDWNLDTLDGSRNKSNPSGATLDLSDGAIFQVPFAYYGYGAIDFEIGVPNNDNEYYVRSVHQQNMKGGTTVDEPNLPITIDIDSGTSGQQLDVFVGGRQISPLGSSDDLFRTSAAWRLEVSSIGTSFVPLISFKHKSTFEQIFVRLGGISLSPDVDMILELHRNSTLSGASFGSFGNYPAAESATEWDVSATSTYTPGEALYTDFVAGGNKGVVSSSDLPKRPISELDTITLAVRRISGTNGTASAIFRVQEDW